VVVRRRLGLHLDLSVELKSALRRFSAPALLQAAAPLCVLSLRVW